jgi:hypothetical protein
MATSLNFRIMFHKPEVCLYYFSTKKVRKINITGYTRGGHLSGFRNHNFGVSRQHVMFDKMKYISCRHYYISSSQSKSSVY